MTMHPDVQYKAQKELDELLKQKRLPVFSDRPQLPFINAIVQETLRYHPPTPMGQYFFMSGAKFVLTTEIRHRTSAIAG